MKTVFDICLQRFVNDYEGSFPIGTPDCLGQNVPWELRIRKLTSPCFEFALTLGCAVLVPCATFSVESADFVDLDDVQSVAFSSCNGYYSIRNFATFDSKQKFCQTAVNVKPGDVLRITLPCQPQKTVRVRCSIDIENVEAESKESSSTIAHKLLKDAVSSAESVQFADVILTTADDRKFHVHSCFLAKQSTVFNAMLQGEHFKEGKEHQIETPDINSATMEQILRYVYTERVNLDVLKVMAPEILYATEKYQLPELLKLQCSQAMIDSLNVSNALSFLITADMFSLDDLKRCAIKVVVDNLNEIRKQDGWKEILEKKPLVDEIFAFTVSCLH